MDKVTSKSNMSDDVVKTENSSNADDGGLSNELSGMAIDSSSRSSSSGKKKKNTCLHCLKEVEGSSRCSKCETASYCSRECQLRHWPVHKNNCRDCNDTDDSNEKLRMKAKNHFDQGNYIHISNDYHHHYSYYNCR